MDNFVYRRFFSPYNVHRMRHHTLPCHNLIDVDAVNEICNLNNFDNDLDNPCYELKDKGFLDSFPCYKKFDYKAGLSSVLHCGSGTCDEAEDLLRKKISWAKKLRELTPKNPEQSYQKIKAFRKKKTHTLSVKQEKFLSHFFDDPEPNFKGCYNWLYTGGPLSNLNFDGSFFLCIGDVVNNNHILRLLELNEDLSQVIDQESFNVKTNEPILQTCCRKKDDNIIISLRQKSRLTVLTTNGKWDLKLKWKKKIRRKKLITCIDVNSLCDEIAVTDAYDNRQNINIYSIETGLKKFGLCKKSGRMNDNWNKINYNNQGIFFIDHQNVSLIDPRRNDYAWKYSPKIVMEECDEICNLMESELNSNYIYLTMTHNLTQLDTRVLKPVQKWTHMMKDFPQHGNIVADGDKELIILQSKKSESFVGITNEYILRNNEYMYLSKSLPCLLKGIKDSIKLAHYNELCLSPLLSKRFDTSVIGCNLIKDKNGVINYFVINSLGDIFRHKIKNVEDEEIEDENKILDSMRKYEAHFGNLNVAKNFVPSKVLKMRQFVESKQQRLGQAKKGKHKKEAKPWKYQEMYAVESLKLYKDFLAEKILRVWGIDVDDDDQDFTDEISVSDKVEGWLEHI